MPTMTGGSGGHVSARSSKPGSAAVKPSSRRSRTTRKSISSDEDDFDEYPMELEYKHNQMPQHQFAGSLDSAMSQEKLANQQYYSGDNVTTAGTHDTGAGPIYSMRLEKVSELGKRVKLLTVALEKERSHKSDYKKRIQDLELEIMDLKEQQKEIDDRLSNVGASTIITADGQTVTNEDVANYKQKMKQLARKLEQEIVKSQTYKRDLQIAQKVLKSELGSSSGGVTSMSDYQKLAESSTWRGRAQQISLLKDRVRELEMQLSSSGSISNVEKPGSSQKFTAIDDETAALNAQPPTSAAPDRTRAASNSKLKAQIEELQMNCTHYQTEIQKLKAKYGASKARIQACEQQNAQIKEQLHVVLEKTALDDQMISKLKHQLHRRNSSIRDLFEQQQRQLGIPVTENQDHHQ